MKTLLIALVSTFILFNGAGAQVLDGRGDKPHFVILLGNHPGGKLSLEELKKVEFLKLLHKCRKEDNSLKRCCEVLGFKAVLINKDGKRIVVINRGPEFGNELLQLLRKAKQGDLLIIGEIVVKCHGKVIKLDRILKYELL